MGQRALDLRAGSSPATIFDVICAGEALWALAPRAAGTALRFRPSGGAVNAAVALARAGVRVGLAASLADDGPGRALLAKVAAAGVDVGGVALSSAAPGLVVVDEIDGASRVLTYRAEDHLPITVPAAWSSQVLLLSGLSPALAPLAALCKAARAARRAGTLVVLDVNARQKAWKEQDPRVLRAILGEAAVVRCSTADLAALFFDVAAVRAAMRREATLVVTDGAGVARAIGPFGEVAHAPPSVSMTRLPGAGDAFTAALCADLARAAGQVERGELWERALRRGHAAAARR